MCGIVAYVGSKEAYPFLIKGLKRLEYRGYDSAGIALMDSGINVFKRKGKVSELEDFVKGVDLSSNIGIGHTRWATHGVPNDTNAHPHMSGNNRLVLVHNGIIENYSPLRKTLLKEGHTFISETDTEVLVHLIEALQGQEQLPLEEAVRLALSRIEGAYAIVVMDKNDPKKLVAARKSSPLVIGVGEDDYFIASDATPFVGHTSQIIYLRDEEIAVLESGQPISIKSIDNEALVPYIEKLDLKIEQIEKSGYDHFMMKEIHEQPKTIADAMRGRINASKGWASLGGLKDYQDKLMNAKRLTFAACGTSWHACLIAEYLIEDLARIPVEVEYASEMRYRNPVITDEDVVIGVSQSGETADTLAALTLAGQKGAFLYGLVNAVGSSIARFTDAGSYIHAGPEIGVASTKAFTGQVTLITLMALQLAKAKGTISESKYNKMLHELESIPKKVQYILDNCDAQIRYIAEEIKDSENALYLGRGYNFPVALEGALKLKEISYIHAEGYPAAEMKHGPIALIDKKMPVIVIATNQSAYEKILSNIQEVKARNGYVIAIVSEKDELISQTANHAIKIPDTIEPLTPLLSVIPLQLLSYYIAVSRGCNVDQPRNLAKSVTVE